MCCSGRRCSSSFRPPKANTLVLLAGALLCACGEDVRTTWTAEVPSPDSQYVATARSQQWGGPGTAWDATTVFIAQRSQRPVQVLGFSHQYGTMRLAMKWLTPRHLGVTYGPSQRPGDSVVVDFQAIRTTGVDISLERFAQGPAKQGAATERSPKGR